MILLHYAGRGSQEKNNTKNNTMPKKEEGESYYWSSHHGINQYCIIALVGLLEGMLLGNEVFFLLITLFCSSQIFLFTADLQCCKEEKAPVPSQQWQLHPPSKKLQTTRVLQGSWHLWDWRLIELWTPSHRNLCTCELSICDLNVPIH